MADRPYRPSSGTEGCGFWEKWCMNCARDAHMNSGKDWDQCEDNEICKIIGDAMAYDLKHPKYPKEWVYKKGVPTCTAFIPVESVVPYRCEKTIDMFEVHTGPVT